MKLINATQGVSQVGRIVKMDVRKANSFVYLTPNSTSALGVITEAVPYRSLCEVATGGDIKVFVSGSARKGDVIRAQKSTDHISAGCCVVAKSTDTPYLKIGTAIGSGKGLILCMLEISYTGASSTDDDLDIIISDTAPLSPEEGDLWIDTSIDLYGESTPIRVVTDTTAELASDGMIVCNKSTAMTINLLPAIGSGRTRQVANMGIGTVTVEGDAGDTISGELNQSVYTGSCLDILDYATGKWIIY